MNTDPIADFLTRIRNAMQAGHRVVEIPASNIKKEILKLMQFTFQKIRSEHHYKLSGGQIWEITQFKLHFIDL